MVSSSLPSGNRSSTLPVPWASLMVSDSDNLDAGRNLSIDDVVGKISQDVSPCTRFEARPNVRRARDQREGSIRFPNERLSRLKTSFKVPLEGIVDLQKSFRGEVNPGVFHSTSPGTGHGLPPRGWSPLLRIPGQPLEQPPLPSRRTRHRPPAKVPGSPTMHPR